MKKLLAGALLIAFAYSGSAFAGWGAIAYSYSTGRSAEAHGFYTYGQATQAAINTCGYDCTVLSSEYNSCIALATDHQGHVRVSGHYYTASSAESDAVNTCGSPECVLRTVACY